MNAISNTPALGTHKVARVIALMLAALVVSAAIAFLGHALTASAPATPVHATSRAAASNPVGDRWWQEQPYAAPTGVARDAWWNDEK